MDPERQLAGPTVEADVPVLDLVAVGRVFDADPPVHALRDVDLRVGEGEYVAIVGPSGSGKSTLLNVIGLLDRPTSGDYWLDGVEVSRLSEHARAAVRAERVGFVFQSFHLLPHRSALENVMFGSLYQGISRPARLVRAQHALSQVGLASRAAFSPTRLSGGERQRVAIARALSAAPSVLLCDEPTGNLDTANTTIVLDLLDALVAGGLTVLVITHDANVAARAQRRVGIIDGILQELA
ncbi:MAG: ABC transporter ATP-binding protein [Ilumatobacteraceae bacterium]